MPAFGPTHSEEELWSIVAFLRRLPELTAEQYKAMVEKEKEENPEHGDGYEHLHEH
jgi:mono/diheme cytochrome c family protein